MDTILTLLSNSSASGLILVSIVFIACAASLIHSIVLAFKIGSRYIFDGGDASVPCLMSFVAVFLITVILFLQGFFSGIIKAEIPLMITIMFITLVAMMLRGRILGYPTVNITPFKKTIMLYVGGIATIAALIGGVALYDSNTIIYFHGYTFSVVSDIMYSSLACTLKLDTLMPIMMGVTTIIMELMIIYFDKKEFRALKTIIADLMLVTSTIIYTICGIFQEELIWITHTPITVALFLFILASIIVNFNFEVNGVLHRSTKINTVVDSTQKLINIMANKKSYTKNDQYRFNQILRVIKDDKEIKESIFATNYISFNRKKNDLIARLKEACDQDKERGEFDISFTGLDRRAKT
jgi:hypothetical protein